MYRRKVIVAIADGLGDRPVPELVGLTPLQKALTPNLDLVAAGGVTGIMDLVGPGIPVGTDLGHLILFGASAEDYPGRGPIEAAGIAMPIRDGDVLFRVNFATTDSVGTVLDRRAGRISRGAEQLAAALDGLDLGDGITAFCRPATEHRAVLVLHGPDLGGRVTDTDPKGEGLAIREATAVGGCVASRKTASALNRFMCRSRDILAAHPLNREREAQGMLPANAVLTRGAGKYAALPVIPGRMGFSGCCVAAEATVLGAARLTGYATVTRPAFTANADTDHLAKAVAALEALGDHDLVFVHYKATDLAGHDNRPLEKVRAIEHFDAMVGAILGGLPPDAILGLAADHSTPCEVGEHSGDPVPIAFLGPSVRRDRVGVFDEIECAHGGLGRITGNGFASTVFDLLGRSRKQGN